jgi:Asp-tRNA(Asn)/Glu-tRNA(Gln) amidotransferase C subunit
MKIKGFNSFNEGREEGISNYMFFTNLENIVKMANQMLEMDKEKVDEMLTNRHDWAGDHIAKSMESISHVYFFMKEHKDEIMKGDDSADGELS